MPPTKPFIGSGAAIERDLVRKFARRRIADDDSPQTDEYQHGYAAAFAELIVWLDAQPQRTAAKVGGLGRK